MKMKRYRLNPFRFAFIGALAIPVFPCAFAAEKIELPPANVFDMEEIRNPDTLDLKIISDEIVPVSESGSKRVRRIELEFFSQNWGEEAIRHLASVYLPVGGIDPH